MSDQPLSADDLLQAERIRRRRQADADHNVITHLDQLEGWTLMGLERWKPGVVQYHAVRRTPGGAEMKVGYAKDEVFAQVQLPPNQ